MKQFRLTVTRETIRARNRANAQKSTGPKSQNGKAISAQNARRHGLTSRPDPAQVLTWLAIILDEPDIPTDALFPTERRGLLALALAEAEARLAAAERKLQEFRNPAAICDPLRGLDVLAEMIQEPIGASTWDVFRAADFILRLGAGEKVNFRSIQPTQLRLLDRYLSQARSRRRKAFADWVLGAASDYPA